jgi:hypothetical protein
MRKKTGITFLYGVKKITATKAWAKKKCNT